MSSASGADDRRPRTILSKQTTNVKKKEVQIESGITFSIVVFQKNGKTKFDLELND